MRYMIDTYGNVDLGTLDWNISGSNFYSNDISNKIKKPKDDNTIANIYCNLYRAVPLNASFVEGDMAVSTSGYLYIRNTRYTTAAEFKEAMRGQILRYELETPANGGYLPMYKGRYKVSEVCQLLDKSKYLNNDGYINNGNGTITTKSIPQNFMRFYDDFDIDGSVPTPKELSIAYRTYGHKVLILDSGNNSPDGGLVWEINSSRLNAGSSYSGQGEIFTNNKLPLKDITRSYFYIVNPSGYTFTCAPQLFDLTEMFEAGNEPTTVAEFKEKFPDNVYPYSPYCWAKIKQMRYMTTTKNLFGYSPINVANDIANGTIVESLPNGAIVQGDVGADPGRNNYSNGWFRPGNTPDGPVIKPHLLAGDTVTISCDYLILERNYAFLTDVGIYLNDGSHGFSGVVIFGLEVGKQYRLTATYTVDIEGDYYPIFTINSNKTKVTNIQIEKGSTATPYVPYGYLSLK